MQETITLQDGTTVQVADFEFGFTLDSKALSSEQDDGSVIVEGYASDFGLDRQDEAFEPGAFDNGLKAYMATNPVVLYHHKYDTALGKVLDAHLDQKGLYVRAELDAPEPNTPTADIIRKVKSGVIKGFSVGGKFYRRMTSAGQRIFKCDLREVSITPMPVNDRMLFAVAGKAFDSMEDMETPENTKALEEVAAALDRVEAAFDRLELEGKASGHPDGPKISALLYHLQKVHTLATDTKQDGETSDDVKNRASAIADHVKVHVAALHKLAAKHGPLPHDYAGSMF